MTRRTFQLNNHARITLPKEIQVTLPIRRVFHVPKFELHAGSHPRLHVNSMAEFQPTDMLLARLSTQLTKFRMIAGESRDLCADRNGLRMDRMRRQIRMTTDAMIIVQACQVEVPPLMITVTARTAFERSRGKIHPGVMQRTGVAGFTAFIPPRSLGSFRHLVVRGIPRGNSQPLGKVCSPVATMNCCERLMTGFALLIQPGVSGGQSTPCPHMIEPVRPLTCQCCRNGQPG